jgi:hypothetical protein
MPLHAMLERAHTHDGRDVVADSGGDRRAEHPCETGDEATDRARGHDLEATDVVHGTTCGIEPLADGRRQALPCRFTDDLPDAVAAARSGPVGQIPER